MANSTDTVARLNHLAQHTRITTGELLDVNAHRLRVGDEWMLVGDEVVTRRNDRTLRTDQELMVKNRDHWTITRIHRNHSVTLTGRTGQPGYPPTTWPKTWSSDMPRPATPPKAAPSTPTPTTAVSTRP